MTQSQAIVIPAKWTTGGGKDWVIVERILITTVDFYAETERKPDALGALPALGGSVGVQPLRDFGLQSSSAPAADWQGHKRK